MAVQTMGDAWAASFMSSTHSPGDLDALWQNELAVESLLPSHCSILCVLFTSLFLCCFILFCIVLYCFLYCWYCLETNDIVVNIVVVVLYKYCLNIVLRQTTLFTILNNIVDKNYIVSNIVDYCFIFTILLIIKTILLQVKTILLQ